MSAVAVEGVWKLYGDFPALRDVSFNVCPGQCLALLGRNGAGKTTLLRILAGLSKPARGHVRVFDQDVRHAATRLRTGMLGHGIGIYEELSAIENLRIFSAFYGLPASTAHEWLQRVDLARVADSPVREFSRGMRQRLAVARAFLHHPDVLLLDEPFTALDDRAVSLLQSLLHEALRSGATVIMSTHQLREAMELASHVVLLTRGRLAFHGERPMEMLNDPGWLYRTHGE